MFKSRSLTSTIAAAALLTAVPVLAEEPKNTTELIAVRPCCERVQAQVVERAAGVTESGGAARGARQPSGGGDEDLFQQRPYWNGP